MRPCYGGAQAVCVIMMMLFGDGKKRLTYAGISSVPPTQSMRRSKFFEAILLSSSVSTTGWEV